MKTNPTVLLLVILVGAAGAQTPTPANSTHADVQATLQRIEQSAQAAALDLARLRVDKWKADGPIKDQAQANADSISRNLTTALPTLISGVRTAPQNLSANFKLYRNLNALYDVFEGLAESAGAFGSKQEFEALSQHVQTIDAYRRSFGDYMEALTAAKDTELARGRTATPATSGTRPKKIIVDNEPAPKPSKKKR
ncbi:MAG TPA: hypothetical protein VMZ25_02650 [Terriglobales bacterium]|nr:hypothetical protein [Terriglobales bacterium]